MRKDVEIRPIDKDGKFIIYSIIRVGSFLAPILMLGFLIIFGGFWLILAKGDFQLAFGDSLDPSILMLLTWQYLFVLIPNRLFKKRILYIIRLTVALMIFAGSSGILLSFNSNDTIGLINLLSGFCFILSIILGNKWRQEIPPNSNTLP